MHPIQIAAAAACFLAADRAGLLHALQDPVSPVELAERLGLDPRAVGIVLDVLRTQGLIDQLDDGCYVAGEPLRQALVNPLCRPGYWAMLFGHTDEFLRTGKSLAPRSEHSGTRGHTYQGVVSYLAALFEKPARTLAAELDPLSDDATLLDIGAGSAVWSLAQIAAASGNARLSVFDLEPVLPRAIERSRMLGLDAHVSTHAGDYLADPLPPGPFQRVILANVLHLEPADRARELLQRAAAVLAPDGELIVVDALAPRCEREGRAHTAYALYLALRMTDSCVHDEPRLRAWLVSAGLPSIHRVDLDTEKSSLGALVARRG